MNHGMEIERIRRIANGMEEFLVAPKQTPGLTGGGSAILWKIVTNFKSIQMYHVPQRQTFAKSVLFVFVLLASFAVVSIDWLLWCFGDIVAVLLQLFTTEEEEKGGNGC